MPPAPSSFIGLGLPRADETQDVKSADAIVKGPGPSQDAGLRPHGARARSEQQELNTKLREFKTRQITVEERDQVAKLVEQSKAANVDIQIFFDFDSAEILPQGRPSSRSAQQGLEPEARGRYFPHRRAHRRQRE